MHAQSCLPGTPAVVAPTAASGSTSSSVPPATAAATAVAAPVASGRAPPLLPPFHPPPPPPCLSCLPSASSLSSPPTTAVTGVGSLADLQHHQQEHHPSLNPPSSSSSPTSLPHFGDGQQALLPTWRQQQQHHQHLQQQSPHVVQFRQPLHDFRNSTQPNEGSLSYQTGAFQGVTGSSSGGGPSGPQSLLLPTRAYTDIVQQQMPMHVSIEAQGVHQQVQGQLQTQAYLQQSLYAAQKKVHASLQQGKAAAINQAMNSDEGVGSNNVNFQSFRQFQGRQGQNSSPVYNKATGQFLASDQHMDKMHEIRNDLRSQQSHVAQSSPNVPNIIRPASGTLQSQQHLLMNGLPQMRTLQSHPFDHSSAAVLASHAQYISPQLLPHLQAHLAALQKAGDVGSTPQHFHPASLKSQTNVSSSPKSQINLSSSGHDLSLLNRNLANAHGSAGPEGLSGPSMTMGNARSSLPSGVPSNPNLVHMQQSGPQAGELSVDRGGMSMNRSPNAVASLVPAMASKSSYVVPTSQKLIGAMAHPSSEQSQLQHLRQVQQHLPRLSTNNNNSPSSNVFSTQQAAHYQQPQLQLQQQQQPRPQLQPQPQPQPQRFGFTRQQLLVLKSQILAFRRLKRGECTLPMDVLRSIGPPPLASQQNHFVLEAAAAAERASAANVAGMAEVLRAPEKMASEQHSGTFVPRVATAKVEGNAQEVLMRGERKESLSMQQTHANIVPVETNSNYVKPEENHILPRQGSDFVTDQGAQLEQSSKNETVLVKASTSNQTMAGLPTASSDAPLAVEDSPAKKIVLAASQSQKATQPVRRYRGPLYDFPPVAKKVDGTLLSSSLNNPWGGPITFAYDVRQLLSEEGVRVLGRKRAQKLKFIDTLLASSVEKKQLSSELVLKLKIEQRKLRLLEMQTKIREEVEQHQQEIMAMGERGYRKFVRLCERQRAELARQVLLLQKATREKHVKALFQWRKRLLEAHWASRDGRTTRNRGVAKYHERMLREYSKRKDEDRNKRMEALKNNDVDTYREMLKQQQTHLTGDAGERYEVLSSFLTQTEEYLQSLGGKISAVKVQQEREEAAFVAVLAAKAQGLSEEEVEAAASQAMEEVEARNQPLDFQPASVNKYYNLAHAVNERVFRQPSMLRAGILRDYQLVGLQWMLSLYNNRLNGILADEMGLGKTVQVMALIAYLMEFKGNYGPHLIIVPNAVIVNWKSELLRWIPSVSCIFYVGAKEQRTRLYTQEICAMKFNVLVTTYEFIMRDRAKLSKVDWKYLIIDEAQRMKDRESRLARDLDRFRCQRRLLLTGTPLQNDLQELWSLLNLLLPEVFDNSKAFHDWFSTPFQKDGPSQNSEDDWLETEKKVIVIHRLHQILEPFMLRRRVEDVEGSLPQKVSVVLRCKMSALQAAIYDWIKTTGTIRLDPDDETARVALGNGKRQMRAYTPLQNKCMELRKVCNHPSLNYPSFRDHLNDFAVRSCGKLWMLDRILTKLHKTGHRVLLFSTMTKLLDILEEYLQWRNFTYRRIDGTTTLESRESAIVDFNRPGSDCFIFLLSIRAAGRGLNLQSADTVVIYDPDPNPKNEEQAVARAHRIGQKREVKVIYMEAVVETIASYQKEDELRSGGTLDVDDEMAGKDRYVGSVESLVRNTIQQHKIDMADEVINAGRFDQRTTQEERRLTLEALLHDEERYQERVHDVPTMQEVNRMIARSEEEVDLFDQMDDEYDWPGEMLQHHEIPKWLRVSSREVNGAMAAMSRQASKKGIVESFGTVEEEKRLLAEPFDADRKLNLLPAKPAAKARSRLSGDHKIDIGKNEDTEEEHGQRIERDVSSDDEEEGEIREEIEDDEDGAQLAAEQEEGELSEEEHQLGSCRDVPIRPAENAFPFGEQQHEGQDAASESSHDEDDETERAGVDTAHTPTFQKFGSLAALESRPTNHPLVEELEEGEIVASGDSPLDAQASESWAQDKEEGEEEQVVQPRTKRKRSARRHCRRSLDKLEENSSINHHDRRMLPAETYHSQWPSYELDRQYYQFDRQVYKVDRQVVQRFEEEGNGPLSTPMKAPMESLYWRSNEWGPPLKRRHLLESVLPNRPMEIFAVPQPPQSRPGLKHIKATAYSEQEEDVVEISRENLNTKVRIGVSPSCGGGGRMPENTQKKCKAVLQKLQGAVNKDGRQIAILFELPKRNELPGYYRMIVNPIDARTIEQHLDRFDYGSVLDFAADVQLMLDNATRYYNSNEVKADARRLQALFFQRMGLNFPDVDFSSVKTRSLATLSQHVAPAVSSPRQQNAHGVVGRTQTETSGMERSSLRNVSTTEENLLDKGSQKESKRVAKETKVRFVEKAVEREKRKVEGETVEPDNSEEGIRHPVDLVFCKKKRKDREKVANKVKLVSVETESIVTVGNKVKTSNNQINKGSGVLKGRVKGARAGPVRKVQGCSQAGVSNGTKNTGPPVLDQWLIPVKKMRTDSGKRRPSHL